MKNKIKFNFMRLSDSDLETKAGFILQSMTGNPHFLTPIPTLADLQTAVAAYSAALVNAADKSRMKVAEKNQARQTLELLLGQLGMYVMYIANGDEVILTSSGFSLAKTPEPQIIANPGSVSLTPGVSVGEMEAFCKTVAGARSYNHLITPAPLTEESVWESTSSSRSKMRYSNLVSGEKYYVRIEAVGSQNQRTLSPESSMFVM